MISLIGMPWFEILLAFTLNFAICNKQLDKHVKIDLSICKTKNKNMKFSKKKIPKKKNFFRDFFFPKILYFSFVLHIKRSILTCLSSYLLQITKLKVLPKIAFFLAFYFNLWNLHHFGQAAKQVLSPQITLRYDYDC